MEKNENKIDVLKGCLTLAAGCACFERKFLEDEDEDFFPELTKEFDNLVKKSESPTTDFEDSFVSAATDFLKNLVQTAYNEIAKRFAATYSERLEVKSVLSKIIEAVNKDEGCADPIDLNTKSAIAIRSVIPQLRKINQVYYLPLKNENARIKTTKGRYFLDKIELIQDTIYHFKSKTVNYKKYMNYERNLLSAYILAKRIEDADTLFNKQGFYANVEGVCKLLEGESEKLIKQISRNQIELISLLKDPDMSSCDNFWRQLNEICGTLDNEILSISSAIRLFLIHHKNGRLPKNPETELLIQCIRGESEKIQTRILIGNEGIKENFKEVAKQAGVQLKEAEKRALRTTAEAINAILNKANEIAPEIGCKDPLGLSKFGYQYYNRESPNYGNLMAAARAAEVKETTARRWRDEIKDKFGLEAKKTTKKDYVANVEADYNEKVRCGKTPKHGE